MQPGFQTICSTCRGGRRLAGTLQVITRDLPVQIFRLSGIYGPGRNAFENFKKGKARRLVKPGQVFNSIHVADIAGAVSLAMKQPSTRIFNVTDDEPAPPQDVVAFAAGSAGCRAATGNSISKPPI